MSAKSERSFVAIALARPGAVSEDKAIASAMLAFRAERCSAGTGPGSSLRGKASAPYSQRLVSK